MATSTLADEVRGILRKQGPSTIDEIYAKSEIARSRTHLATNIYQMGSVGLLGKERDGKQVVYRLPTEAEQKAAGTQGNSGGGKVGSKKAAGKKKATNGAAPSCAKANGFPHRDGAELLLEDNRKHTQKVLDAYIESLDHPEAMKAVLLARDVAKDALDAWKRDREEPS